MSLGKKLLIGIGTLAVLSLIIGFAVSDASAKAEVKAREAAQVQQQQARDTADAELKVKQAEQDKEAAVAEAIANAETDAEAVREEDVRIAEIDEANAVQAAIAKQKKVALSTPILNTPAPNVPILSTPVLNAPTPVTSGVTESSINGNFDGWTGDTIFKLQNGQIWQQSSFAYTYHWAFSPKVMIYQSGSGYKMNVDGVDSAISVTRIK